MNYIKICNILASACSYLLIYSYKWNHKTKTLPKFIQLRFSKLTKKSRVKGPTYHRDTYLMFLHLSHFIKKLHMHFINRVLVKLTWKQSTCDLSFANESALWTDSRMWVISQRTTHHVTFISHSLQLIVEFISRYCMNYPHKNELYHIS